MVRTLCDRCNAFLPSPFYDDLRVTIKKRRYFLSIKIRDKEYILCPACQREIYNWLDLDEKKH